MAISVRQKVHEFFSAYPKRHYPKGQILVFTNENPEYIFYLTAGKVRKYDVTYRGDEIIINMYQSPSYFPMSWALNHTPNKYFYRTETEVDLHIVPADVAATFLKKNPDVALDLLRRLYRGLESVYGRLVHLMSGTARVRLLYELIIECRRFGEKRPDGSYLLKANEIDLAALSGMARETVSREMHKLKAKGWITVTKSGITVSDIAQLEAALGNET
jgi:CRP/FNR family transcriptional regulator